MFLIPFPSSEVLCFISMIFTWLYLFVGVLGNYHQNPSQEIADNASVHDNQKILRFEQTSAVQSKSISWDASQKSYKKDVCSAFTIFPEHKILSFEIKRAYTAFEPSLSKVSLRSFTNRGPPLSLS
jgi:hypothetical protein